MSDAAAKVDPTLGKIKTLLHALLEVRTQCHEKEQAILDELENLAGGGVSIGVRLRQFEKDFSDVWQTRYKTAYHYHRTTDVPAMKRLLRSFTSTQLHDRALNFVRSDIDFYRQTRHRFDVFAKNINELAPDYEATGEFDLEAPTVPDCKHHPPCASDQIHTARKMADLRGRK